MAASKSTYINRGGLTGLPFVSLYDAKSERIWNAGIPFTDFPNEKPTTEKHDETPGLHYYRDATPDEIILARLPTLVADANAGPCRRCGSLFRWRDCYSTTNLHCDKCSKPPSLAMVKQVFGLIEMNGKNGDDGFAWLDLTERMKPIMQIEQAAEMRAKRTKERPLK
jgi:hypothetical protein